MFKVAVKVFKNLTNGLSSTASKRTDFVVYFPASEDKQIQTKRLYLDHYVGNRGKIIAEIQETLSEATRGRSGLQRAKAICAARDATLIMVQLDHAGRGTVNLFTPPALTGDRTTRSTRSWAASGRPQLVAAS